jgi:starch-binding outer membrane protein, SusD/RagB family
MKNIKLKITGILLLALLAASCKKQLDQRPTNAVPVEDVFKTNSDFAAATIGMYNRMVRATYLGDDDGAMSWSSTPDLLADNLISQQTGRGSQRTFGNWQYNASNTTSMFEQGYSVIRAANAILENIGNYETATAADTAAKNNFQGEALAIRATIHFDLLRVYSKPVSGSQADPNGLGIPYVTSTSLSDMPGRGTVKAAYDRTVADLLQAAQLIKVNNGVGRLNKAAVYGLLSRVYLYGGEWSNCVAASDSCLAINSDPASITDFPSIWTDKTEKGVIFKLKIIELDNIKIGVGYSQTSSAGVKSEWVCSYSLYQMYDSTDVRTKAYILKAKFGGVEYNAINKYMGRGSGSPGGLVDLKYLRVAEVLLNRAEAQSILGVDANALTDLNLLRQNRYKSFIPGTETGQALKDAIARQRRLEMAFESDRWFELKRKGLPVKRDDFGDLADGTGTKYFVKDLPASDNRWQIPLSQGAVNANINLTQNPGF